MADSPVPCRNCKGVKKIACLACRGRATQKNARTKKAVRCRSCRTTPGRRRCRPCWGTGRESVAMTPRVLALRDGTMALVGP